MCALFTDILSGFFSRFAFTFTHAHTPLALAHSYLLHGDPNSQHLPLYKVGEIMAVHSYTYTKMKSAVCHKFLLIVSALLMFTAITL